MTQTTETTAISATRLMDVAREITLRLGEWAHHPDLSVHIATRSLGLPSVFVTLADRSDDPTRRDFIQAFADVMDAPVDAYPRPVAGGQMLVVTVRSLLPVEVSASVNVGGAR